jgi:voltage-gated sodium channel
LPDKSLSGAALLFGAQPEKRKRNSKIPFVMTNWKNTPLPPQQERLISVMLEKKVAAGHLSWQMRELILTSDALLFARPGIDAAVECVPLISIVNIQNIANIHDAVDGIDSNVIKIDLKKEAASSQQTDKPISLSQATSGKVFSRTASVDSSDEGILNAFGYVLRAKTKKDAEDFTHAITKALHHAQALEHKMRSQRERFNHYMRSISKSRRLQYAIFTLIVVNFFVNCLNFELLPEPDSHQQDIFDKIDTTFTALFTVEIFIHMYVEGLRGYLTSVFNILDTIVILVSWAATFITALQDVSVLRLFRVARIVRLARRLTSLKTLAISLKGAVYPIFNTYGVIVAVTCLYAVLCVMFFGESNPELFGRWTLAMFTLFQVASGDGWVTTIVRPMMLEVNGELKGKFNELFPAIFFISYYVIVSVVLFNIIVAIFLDEFMVASEQAKERQKMSQIIHTEMVLDPLLRKLSTYTTSHDLSNLIDNLYKVLDLDDNGGIAFHELRKGLYNASLGGLQYNDFPILLTEDDWTSLTENGKLLNENGEIGPSNFRVMLQRQLSSYIQRQIALVMTDTDPSRRAMFGALKLQLLHLHRAGLDDIQDSEGDSPRKGLDDVQDSEGESRPSAELASDVFKRRSFEKTNEAEVHPHHLRGRNAVESLEFKSPQLYDRRRLEKANEAEVKRVPQKHQLYISFKTLRISLPPWKSKYLK